MSNYKTILIPTDLSEASEPAADRAKSLADLSGAKIVLLHIVDYFLPGQAGKLHDIAVQYCHQRPIKCGLGRRHCRSVLRRIKGPRPSQHSTAWSADFADVTYSAKMDS